MRSRLRWRSLLSALIIAGMSLVGVNQVNAQCNPVNINISTGIDNAGNILPVGSTDPNWTNGNGLNIVVGPYSGWSSLAGSAWLGNHSWSNPSNTNYTFTRTFTTTGAGTLTFQALADNNVIIQLDNIQIANTPGMVNTGFQAANVVNYTGPVTAGTHTITAIVFNQSGPVGLTLTGNVNYTPAPTTIDISTGYVANSPLPVGSTDPNWSEPGGYNVVVNPNGAWDNFTGSQWLGDASSAPAGFYTFTYNFTTTANGTLTFDALADNYVIFDLNGNTIAQTPGLTVWGFQLANQVNYSGFIPAGSYTLTATVYNEGGPMGLNVHGTVSYCDGMMPPCDVDPDFTTAWNSPSTVDFFSSTNPVNQPSPFWIVSHYWDFGDGNTSTLDNPTHNYNANGTFTVTHVVYKQIIDQNGTVISECKEEKICRLRVVDLSNTEGYATLRCGDPEPCDVDPAFNVAYGGYNTVDFTSSTNPVNLPSAYSNIYHYWDFGDGNTSTATDPSHTYGSSGSYQVSHVIYREVLDDDGNVKSDCKEERICKITIWNEGEHPEIPRPFVEIECRREAARKAPVAAGIMLYPNPAGDFINIRHQSENYSVDVFSLEGKLVASAQNASGEHQLNISQLPDGTYLVRISEKGAVTNLRFTKMAH